MQDRDRQLDEILLRHTAGPYIRAKTSDGGYLALESVDEANRDRPVMLICGTPLHFLAEENCSARPSSIWNTVSTP